jgi:hypothetical protein
VTKALAAGATIAIVATSSAAAGGIVPTPIGAGPRFHPGPRSPLVERAAPVGALTCSRSSTTRVGVHLELFARDRVVVVPAGIGMAPPLRTSRGYVVSGRCSYAVRTREPTGVIEVARTTKVTLGHFFAVWGQPLQRNRLAGFRDAGPVRAYVDGIRVYGSPRSILLRRHAEIVLELGAFVPPHSAYAFPKGL